ncbi:MAG: tRNA (N(6)-L-threonylcarbamoyladenosine(37)-C(2))-methylthiotransferase MtaB [Clostridia bacterium]|jgi:threonylcarbamoyladenosine tRNA methylthiotransferase MtaB
MKKAAFYTLGCKVNQYETESISELFAKKGYELVDFEAYADVYVINTCTVTGLSDRKSRQIIRRAIKNNPDSIVAVIGCYAQTSPGEVREIPGVSLIIGTKDKNKVVENVEKIQSTREKDENKNKSESARTSVYALDLVSDIKNLRKFEEIGINSYHDRTRAFIKVQEGCNQFCSYCIIPYARGPLRSRSYENVIKEVTGIADNGYKEVVLTGIHLASYGKDLKEESLLKLIKGINEIDGIERIRLGSIEPTTITEEFIEMAGKTNKLCPHFHISLQSGCDETLRRMNRKYTTEFYKKIVWLLREKIPDVSVTTDVMVGFPGETDDEFEKTFEFLSEIELTKMHVFKYSARKGTPAAEFDNQIAPLIKEKRSRKLLELSNSCSLKFNKKFTGRNLPVLFEQVSAANLSLIDGLTPNHIKAVCSTHPTFGDGSHQTFGDSSQFCELRGTIKNVVIDKAYTEDVSGHITD